MTLVGVDTSVAVALLVATHSHHGEVHAWAADQALALCGHAVAETYAVLTRLPGDARLAGDDAALLMQKRFAPALVLPEADARAIPETLAGKAIAGGATYDALIGLTAVSHGVVLATRDARAQPTYHAVGATVLVVG